MNTLTGKLRSFGELKEGSSQKGAWRKQDFVIETLDEKYPKLINLEIWNDGVDKIKSCTIGDTLSIPISIESREHNSKWYTTVKAIGVNVTSSMPKSPYQAAADVPDPIGDVNDNSELPF